MYLCEIKGIMNKDDKTYRCLKYRYDVDYLVCFDFKNNTTLHGKIFGHVFIMRNVSGINSIKINPTINGTLIVPFSCNINSIYNELSQEYSVYVYTVKHEDIMKMNIMFGCTCVSIVKNLLGIRAWWIQTPRQLERYISRREKHG